MGERYLSRSAPTRGMDDLISHLPDDLFDEAPSVEKALEPIHEVTMADLQLVRECAGSPGPVLKRFVPESSSSPTSMMMQTPAQVRKVSGMMNGTTATMDSPSFTLSPQSSLKPGSVGGDSQLGSSLGRSAGSPQHSSPSPPVAVYSYASNAGSSGGHGRGSLASGRPPRADRAGFTPGSVPHARSGSSFGQRNATTSSNKASNPPVKFTGSGFRAARDEYLDKVLEFLSKNGGEDWITIKSKQGVSGKCRKPVTMPETYLEFFDSHRDKFELNPELTKVRLRTRSSRISTCDSVDSDDTNVGSMSASLKEKLSLQS